MKFLIFALLFVSWSYGKPQIFDLETVFPSRGLNSNSDSTQLSFLPKPEVTRPPQNGLLSMFHSAFLKRFSQELASGLDPPYPGANVIKPSILEILKDLIIILPAYILSKFNLVSKEYVQSLLDSLMGAGFSSIKKLIYQN